jgi:hypothetical protein
MAALATAGFLRTQREQFPENRESNREFGKSPPLIKVKPKILIIYAAYTIMTQGCGYLMAGCNPILYMS